jgi:hypothetical protein
VAGELRWIEHALVFSLQSSVAGRRSRRI